MKTHRDHDPRFYALVTLPFACAGVALVLYLMGLGL